MFFLLFIFTSFLWRVESTDQPTRGPSTNATEQKITLSISTDDTVNQTQLLRPNLQNTTLNRTEEENGTFSGTFHYLAGIRAFNPEVDVEMRIIGGQEAWAHSWPWQVSLRFATMPACGGAIIAPLWVVTAAHCFKRYNKASFWTVLAGKHDLDNPHEVSQQLVGVSKIMSHSGYNTRTKEGDVALLKLQASLIFNQYVRPIDIWMKPLEPFRNCTITGWGSTRENGPRVNRLQEVNVTCLPFDMCNQYYRGRIRPTMFCAGQQEGGADACQGDSGGPLSCYTGIKYELAGLVSWGVGCGRAKKPGVYTKLQDHTGWISAIITSNETSGNGDSGLISEENTESCGEGETSPCRLGLVPAGLTDSQEGEVEVSGVTEACPNSWPWQVSLQSRGKHYCSGTLIHRHWVLVPKHCYCKAKADTVVLGVHDLRFMSSQTIPVDEVFSLPRDHSFPPASDLSLLRLSVPVRFSASVFPVCLPDEDVELDDSWSCVTTGWEATKAIVGVSPYTLHQARLSLCNQSVCKQSWGEDLIRDTHLCSHPAGSVSCMGDFGAPLFCQKHGVYYLFGMVTWGSKHCDAHKPAIFSSIPAYHLWITEITDDI